MVEPLIVGANPQGKQVAIYPAMANRHGLIAGATGTGKTVTLQILAEQFSDIGVPVFLVDVKGDLSGLGVPGKAHPKVTERIEKIGLSEPSFHGYPLQFWDVYGQQGTPARTTIADMGPVLISTLLDLNDTQSGVVTIAFAVAKKQKLPLLNLADLKSMLGWLAENSKTVAQEYGNVSASSVGAIQRRLLTLSEAGGDVFFGEPALEIAEFMRLDENGRGIINLLSGDKLILNPLIYSTFLFWLLTELFENLPEQGDAEKPKLVFFFDEAHLLFDNAPDALLDRIEQVVRLIRSKGVGIYFVTQSPSDIPDDVLGQLGNRFQHALRAFTPRDQKAVKIAAETFRPNPTLDVNAAITSMGVGEALVSVLDQQGTPTLVEQTLIRPPYSRIGPMEAAEKLAMIEASSLHARYKDVLDSESAYELLNKRSIQKEKKDTRLEKTSPTKKRRSNRQSYGEALGKSLLRSLGSQLGRNITRAIMSALKGKR